MSRKIDSEGRITDPKAKIQDVSEPTPSLRIEIPLWKYGRIAFESNSPNASVSVLILLLMSAMMIGLGLISALASLVDKDAGLASLLDTLGKGWMLVLGVVLGASGRTSRR